MPVKVREDGAGDFGPPFDFEEKVLAVAIESCLLELFLLKRPMLGARDYDVRNEGLLDSTCSVIRFLCATR